MVRGEIGEAEVRRRRKRRRRSSGQQIWPSASVSSQLAAREASDLKVY